MYPSAAILVVLFASAARIWAQAPASTPAGARHFDAFLAQLQRASLADDRNTVAAMVRYPIVVSIGGLRVPFADAAALLERYGDIFNPPLRAAIARATVSDGTVVGLHDVAIGEVNGQLRITSIIVPHDPGDAVAPVATTEPSRTARRQDPRRVAIRVGPRPTQIPGLLAPHATDVLLLYLPKGRLAGVRLERVPAGMAVLRVVHARTGTPLGARASSDGRYVSGRPSESADYRIEVRRTRGVNEEPLPYMLSLTLR